MKIALTNWANAREKHTAGRAWDTDTDTSDSKEHRCD